MIKLNAMKIAVIPILFLCATSGLAQVNVSTIQTPYGNATVHSYRPQNYGNYASSFNRSWGYKHKFFVDMKDGRQLMVYNIIDRSDSIAKLVLVNETDSMVIRPADTKLIVTMVYRTNERFEGIPADTTWLFKTVKGKINGYSPLAEKNEFVFAIQKDDGPIVPLTKANLIDLVGTTDPKLLKLIEKEKFVDAIKTYNKNTLR